MGNQVGVKSVHLAVFSQTTTIGFDLEEKSHVRMALFDISGGKILELINAEYLPGAHEKVFDARGLTGGLYYYTIWVNGNTQTKKLVANK